MKPPYEDLSKLMDGDLPPAEALALQVRIGSEPEVARAWKELHGLVEGIERLPEERPPAALDARVLAPPAVRDRRWVAALVGGVALLAATALVAVRLVGQDPARIVLVQGQQLVDGDVALVAGDVPVEVHGLARVTVEPPSGSVRVPAAEEDPMIKLVGSGVGGAVLGALVTVAVIDGTATVRADGADVVVSPGEARTFQSGAPRGVHAPPPRVEIPADATPAQRIAALQAENDDLRDQLQEATFSGAVARGQVAETQGKPTEWPAKPAEGWAPEQFEANLRAAVAKIPGLTVHEVDCAEYPCVATLTTTESGPDVAQKLKEMAQGLTATTYPDAGVAISVSTADDGKAESTGIGLSLLPSDAKDDPNLGTRTNYRTQSLLEGMHEPTP